MVDTSGYKVGVVLSVEECSKTKSGKALKACKVNVGDADSPLSIVTSASNVREGSRIIVAPAGTTFLDDEGGESEVKKASVGGVVSEGMFCDSRMLGWAGGAQGVAAILPDTFEVGSAPPAEKPRPKQEQESADIPEAGPGLFEKKLTKEEKKKLAEERRAARKAKKAAKASEDK